MADTGDQALTVELPAGILFVPRGQQVPEITPGIGRLFAAARARGLLGSDTLADAVWATRGFTRADVEQTGLGRITDGAARDAQALLLAANLGYEFERGGDSYARLYQQRSEALAREGTTVHGTAILPNGHSAELTVLSDSTRRALVRIASTKGGAPLFYAGHVLSRQPDRMEIELLHLKTGRPLQAAPGPLTVRLAQE
jgi:hypothetical protein